MQLLMLSVLLAFVLMLFLLHYNSFALEEELIRGR